LESDRGDLSTGVAVLGVVPITSEAMGRVLNTIRKSGRLLSVAVLVTAAAACGSDDTEGSDSAAANSSEASTDASGERAQIVVTTNILGDVVTAAVGDQADVEVIMPLGSDPHDFAPSARQAESMENADLLIVNGAGFEEGMLDIIENVSDSGTEVFSFAEQIDLIEFTGEHHDEHGDEHGDEHSDEEPDDHGDEHSDEEHDDHGDEHSDEEHDEHGDEHSDEEHDDDKHSDDDHDDHGHEDGDDPHIWTDPTRIMTAVESLEPAIAGLAGVDGDALASSFDVYLAELAALDSAMEDALATVPEDGRVLVTNHAVFGYFAERFDFEVVGAVVPSLTTNAEPSASDIDDLVGVIEDEGIDAIFGETTRSTNLAAAIAEEVDGDIEVVVLFSESLGEEGSGAETYIGMMQSNAELIAGALS